MSKITKLRMKNHLNDQNILETSGMTMICFKIAPKPLQFTKRTPKLLNLTKILNLQNDHDMSQNFRNHPKILEVPQKELPSS